MSFNLLDTVKGLFTPALISNAATSLGESESGIQKALGGAIPALLASLVNKGGSADGASVILDLAKHAAGSGVLNNLGGFLGDDNSNLLSRGAEMLKNILGDKAGGIASLVSNFAGIKHSSASSILSTAAPVALGALGKHAAENNMNANGLSTFLSSQKDSITNALPSGLSSMAGLFGLGSIGNAVSSATSKITEAAHSAAPHAEVAVEKTSGGVKFLLPLFFGLLAVFLLIFVFKGCNGSTKDVTAITDSIVAKTDTAVTEIASNVRELFKVKWPNDTAIDAYKGGIQDKLVAFLGTDHKKLGEDSLKKIWFDFDNLNFETGTAKITAQSQVQLNNLAAILKAFPAVILKIGGYIDKTGEQDVNKKVSDQRSKAIQAALAEVGVGKQITGAEGCDSSFAVYAKDAPESRSCKRSPCFC
jgi:outer membrane protein OmpA-like peptidoglycan-associated protein